MRNRNSFTSAPASPGKELMSLLKFNSSIKEENDDELKEMIANADEEIDSLTKELQNLEKIYLEKQQEYKEIQEKFQNLE